MKIVNSYFSSAEPSDFSRVKIPALDNQQVSGLTSNFITARLKSPPSDPNGREAGVTSALKRPLSGLYGRKASLTAGYCSRSTPFGREASLIAVKNPPSDLTVPHYREVGVNAVKQCDFNNTSKRILNNKNHKKIKTDSKVITKINQKIKKDSMGIIKTNEKIKKDSAGIIKNNQKIKKDSIRITKTEQKIEKDLIKITKSHEKITKSKKNIKKIIIKTQPMSIISTNNITKCMLNNKKHKKIKKDSIGITKINQKIKKDSMGIIKTKQKIKKDLSAITKINQKIKKDSIRITKNEQKIKSDLN